MPILNPPGAPTGNLATQDIYSISRYLNDPTFVYRALATIADQMFVGTKVLKGQFFTDDGSIIYEQIESIFANGNPQGVAPGAEYPLASIPTGPAQIATTVKWGLDTIITDESINRQRINVLEKAFIKLANSLVQQVDDVIMSVVQSAITQQFNAGSPTLTGATPGSGTTPSAWNGDGSNKPTIMRDVMYATQIIRGQKQGYSPDTVLCDLQTYAAVIGDPTIAPTLPREDMGSANVGEAPVLQGINSGLGTRLFGMNWLASPNLPSSPYVAVLDSKVFGAMVDERLPAPGYTGVQSGAGDDEDGRSMIQVKTMREDDVDRWRIRARRTTTPIVIEPLAAVEIVGVG